MFICIPDTKQSLEFLKRCQGSNIPLFLIIQKEWENDIQQFEFSYIIVNFFEDKQIIINEIKKLSYIFTQVISFSEKNVMLASSIREYFNIPGLKPKEAILFRDKLKMRMHVEKYLPMLNPIFIKNNKQNINTIEWLVKPRDSWASQNIEKFSSLKEAIEFKNNNKHTKYIIEQFIESSILFHCGGMVDDQNILYIIFAQHDYSCLESINLDKDSYLYWSICKNHFLYERLFSTCQDIIRIFPSFKSLFEIELLYDPKNDKIYFCEIAARPATGCTEILHERLISINPYHLFSDIYTVKKRRHINIKNNNYTALYTLLSNNGVIKKIDVSKYENIHSIKNIYRHKMIGDIIVKKTIEYPIISFLIEHSTVEEIKNISSQIKSEECIVIDNKVDSK